MHGDPSMTPPGVAEGPLRRVEGRLSLEDAARFHGHLGPFLALGFRAGEAALKELGEDDPAELKATVSCPPARPYTCFIDGVQCSTRCTLGKGNIEVRGGGELRLRVEGRSGRVVELRVRGEALRRAEGGDLDWVLSARLEELFELVERKRG